MKHKKSYKFLSIQFLTLAKATPAMKIKEKLETLLKI